MLTILCCIYHTILKKHIAIYLQIEYNSFSEKNQHDRGLKKDPLTSHRPVISANNRDHNDDIKKAIFSSKLNFKSI
jgi:hypothetical protein